MFSFNSSMVRLGGFDDETITLYLIGFNSSMVRLGVPECDGYPLFICLFQFQYGSIGSPI